MVRKHKHYFLILLIIVSLACALPTFPITDSNTINTAAPTEPVNVSLPTNASTATFTFTPTLIQLTQPNSETPVFTLTLDPNTTTPSITPFPTLTIEPVTI